MDSSFKEGQEVKSITYPDDSQLCVGEFDVEKITVVMEYGQMAGVPWFAVWKDGKVVHKHNAVHIACVEL